MGKATEHVKESHKDIQLTPEFAEKVKSLMKDV
jgi:predicted small metal-binding protein